MTPPPRFLLHTSSESRASVTTHPDRELAVHRYVQQRTSIPTAKIIFSDLTEDNPLEKPYVVQGRIPGTSLAYAYDTMNHEQRKDVARQWGQLILQEQAVKNTNAGEINAVHEGNTAGPYKVCLWDTTPELINDFDDIDPSSDRRVLKMFLTQFKRWEKADLQHCPTNCYSEPIFSMLSNVATEMDAAGLFHDNEHHLCHLDLEPRNVLVDVQSDESVLISGVLDWDSAAFAPIFVSCEPPMWLWAWDTDEDEYDSKMHDVPDSPEDREIKQIFEETMGHEFLAHAYAPEYRLARKLFEVAMHGLRRTDLFDTADKVIAEWAALKADKTATNSPSTKLHSSEKFENHEEIEVDHEDGVSKQCLALGDHEASDAAIDLAKNIDMDLGHKISNEKESAMGMDWHTVVVDYQILASIWDYCKQRMLELWS